MFSLSRAGRAALTTVCLSSAILLPRLARAQPATTGILRGTVVDAGTGEPLPFANVVIIGAGLGMNTVEDGTFTIREVPTGTFTLAVSYVGYDVARPEVTIEPGLATEVEIALTPAPIGLPEVTIYGDRGLVDVRNTSSVKTLSATDIEDLTIEPTLDAVIGQQAGVTVKDGEIHIRGGRSDETLVMVDGVALRDGTSGGAIGNALSAGSAAEVTVVKGGWDAKYGQAISGVVDVRMKEGTNRVKGKVSYQTDAYIGNQNSHYGQLQFEGPNPVLGVIGDALGLDAQEPTFYLDLSTELSDTYLPSIRDNAGNQRLESSHSGTILGRSFEYGSFFRPRGDNSWRVNFKTAWTVHPRHKLTFTGIKSLGYSSLFQATDIGDVNRNITSYPWAWSRRLGHHYTIVDDFYSAAIQWKHTLSDNAYQELRLRQSFSNVHRDVGGKLWSDYERGNDTLLEEEGLGHPFFVDSGDATNFRDRFNELVGADWDLRHTSEHHDVSLGLSGSYEDVQYFSLDAATVDAANPLGREFDLFHHFPAKGHVYLQDRLEYTGINLKIGVRADVFFPGAAVERLYEEQELPGFSAETAKEWDDNTHEIFGRRYKIRWSPRVAVSHPITDRSHFFFNFGRFTQWPSYYYLYAKTGGISSAEFPTIGNPNLEPEVSAQYEFGAGHKLSESFSFRGTVFFKDIYDYPQTVRVTIGSRTTRRADFFFYRNLDYARSRGFELELQKRRTKYASFGAAYSYSVATGKESDPNALKLTQSLGGDAREADLEEQFVWWNRPHKLTFSWSYQVDRDDRAPRLLGWKLPKDWKVSLFWLLQSGEAYTPQSPFFADLDKDFSRNGPWDSVLDLDFSKNFVVAGHNVRFSMITRNLLNHRTVLDIDPSTGFTPHAGVGQHWAADENPATLYENEAALAETNQQEFDFASETRSILRTLAEVQNPAYISAPRTIRLGISYDW